MRGYLGIDVASYLGRYVGGKNEEADELADENCGAKLGNI
jgi:hypothetical protein